MLKENECQEVLFDDKIIIQNKQLYRFTSDSILLSRFARAKKGDKVADFCAGCGVVGFHFLCLNPSIVSLTSFELQPDLADMAMRTAQIDGFTNVTVVQTALQDIGVEYNDAFSLVLCNPPYEKSGFDNDVYEKAICRKEITITLPEIVDIAYRKLKFSGRLCILHRADRLAELLFILKKRGLEPKRLQPIVGVEGQKPYLVMVEAVKGGKEGLDFMPTLVNTARTV